MKSKSVVKALRNPQNQDSKLTNSIKKTEKGIN